MSNTALIVMMFTAVIIFFMKMRGTSGLSFNFIGNMALTAANNTRGSVGRAVYQEQLQLWDKSTGRVTDFNTHFTFLLKKQSRNLHADRMVFFVAHPGLVHDNQTMSNASYPFVAVEFDPRYDHVAINISSTNSSNYTLWYNDGRESIDEAWISYDPVFNILRVVFTGYDVYANATILQNVECGVDLKTVLPERVILGFSAAATTGASLDDTIKSWSFNSSLTVTDHAKTLSPVSFSSPAEAPPGVVQEIKSTNYQKLSLFITMAAVTIVVLVVCVVGSIIWYIQYDVDLADGFDVVGIDEDFERGTGPKKFSYDRLARSTKGFAEEKKVGEGGFGGVYKGFLRELDLDVAVKSVSKGSRQGIKEYASEVKIISRLRHKNLVQLIGWCHERRGLLLVYEFMSNGSLDFHLFKEKSMLTWPQRYKIVQGLASALLYLHEDWEQCVVHRDVKSSNIMLDSNFNAKLGDFGLARLVDHEKGSQTTVLAGTWGYMAPECATTGKASKESDVYSFGIVALEVACGRKPIRNNVEETERVLVEWVWELYGNGDLLEAADARLCGDFDSQQMVQLMIVGLWCAHPDYNIRPSIRQAIQVLCFESPLPDLPSKMPVPTYSPPPVLLNSHSSVSVSFSSLAR